MIYYYAIVIALQTEALRSRKCGRKIGCIISRIAITSRDSYSTKLPYGCSAL